jgi:outer membrane receptor for ferrienterochelin and colicin
VEWDLKTRLFWLMVNYFFTELGSLWLRGERDTRGDSNWVPAEAIESIEVLRGPAAARYGLGAAGGVVNIITKKVTNETMVL